MITVPIASSRPSSRRESETSSVVELFTSMKEQTWKHETSMSAPLNPRTSSNAAQLTSLCADISPSSSHFFEVLYIGKIKVSHKKVPDTFIDDALEKFQLHEAEKEKLKLGITDNNISATNQEVNSKRPETQVNTEDKVNNETLVKNGPNSAQVTSNTDESQDGGGANSCSSVEPVSVRVEGVTNGSSAEEGKRGEGEVNGHVTAGVVITLCGDEEGKEGRLQDAGSVLSPTTDLHRHQLGGSTENLLAVTAGAEASAAEKGKMRGRAASTGSVRDTKRPEAPVDHNRTMLFLVGRTDLKLISPDRKQILLHKNLRDVSKCIQGMKRADHFGFICRESHLECFIGYVFKCQSESFADDVVAAISQAFTSTAGRRDDQKCPAFSCEHCPMVWLHKLCSEIEGMGDKRAQAAIFRRLELLSDDEQNALMARYQGAETSCPREQNEVLMSLLRAHCEAKQTRHVHDSVENRSEFLNQYLGNSNTIFMKAKRSLTSSFDQLLKRKGSRDDFGPIVKELSLPSNATLTKESPHSSASSLADASTTEAEPTTAPPQQRIRKRSSTLGSLDGETMKRELHRQYPDASTAGGVKSTPMMSIFMKVGNQPKTSPPLESTPESLKMSGSWRQAIYNRVVTPTKTVTDGKSVPNRKRDKAELRSLWKKAINQQLILIRMEKENARLTALEEEATVKRIKLEYEEISPCPRQVSEVWDLLISKESRVAARCDRQMLLQAVRQGVPRSKRGDVWRFLADQHCLRLSPPDTTLFPSYHTPYPSLLRQLTSHQHAILIDLGRTFPSHPYFASPLGPGQLALFNLLKAYSLLDPEVGYCQGLSFIAGVLLLHVSEAEAFHLLRHLMVRRQLRNRFSTDMAALQLGLYQLSRLLHDRLQDLEAHLDKHDVAPTLYAAPWLLTIFASQFPLGLVSRVFDLLFLDGSDVIFRFALALLSEHRQGLLACHNFEEIMDYMKTVLPDVNKPTLDRVMKEVFSLDIGKQLREYEVEYQVLQEEMSSPRYDPEQGEKLERENKALLSQNQALQQQLQMAASNIHRLEATRTSQQTSINRLESQVRSLEVSVAAMGNFVTQLSETRPDIELPGEIRRIITQLDLAFQRRSIAVERQKGAPLRVLNTDNQPVEPNRSGRVLKTALSSPNLGQKLAGMSGLFGAGMATGSRPARTGLLSPSEPVVEPRKLNSVLDDGRMVKSNSDGNKVSIMPELREAVEPLRTSQSSHQLGVMHPLMDSSDVNFTYSGTTKLKTLRPSRKEEKGVSFKMGRQESLEERKNIDRRTSVEMLESLKLDLEEDGTAKKEVGKGLEKGKLSVFEREGSSGDSSDSLTAR